MRRVILAVLLASATAFAQAGEGRAAGGIDLQLSRDTDGFEASRLRAMGLWRRDNPWSHQGAAVQTSRYSETGYRRRVQAMLLVHRDQRHDTLSGVNAEAGVARIGGRLRPVGDVTLRFAPRPDAPALELVAAADLVETRRALERGIAFAIAGVGIDVPFTPRFTTTAFAAWQDFTDGNARLHLRGRLIWLADEEQGLTLQARYRGYRSEQEDVGSAYFNPRRYHQALAVAAVRRRAAHWTFAAEAGAGRERVDGRGKPAYVSEVRAEGPLAGEVRVILRAGYIRAAGFVDDPDYAYRYAGLQVVAPLE